MMSKTVTVSIPVYNGEKFILSTLKSVLNQTYKVNKIIICDNVSTDNTVLIANQFIDDHKEFDIKLFINDKNIGFQNNFIKCYNLAKTDFLVILHADDLLKPDCIEKQINFFTKHPEYALVGGNVDVIDANGKLSIKNNKSEDLYFQKGEIYEFIKATSSYLPFSTVMYNLKFCREIEYFEEVSLGPDELYWPVLLQQHPIAILSDSLIDNRSYEGQLHIKNSIKMFGEYVKYFDQKLTRANLETTVERQFITKKLIRKQVATISVNLGQEIFHYSRNLKMSSKYYFYGIKKYKKIVFTRFFLKSILKSFSLYN